MLADWLSALIEMKIDNAKKNTIKKQTVSTFNNVYKV